MFARADATTRRVAPTHRPWAESATQGQLEAVAHLVGSHAALLVADPGAGKTAITLKAFMLLKEQGVASKMLIVAPLRVCQLVWRQEGQKWTEFRDLRFSFLHGDDKAKRLRDDADVWLINPEGCQWLSEQFYGRRIPWDTVVIDETTKFKNAGCRKRGKRASALRTKIRHARRRWGLTGTLIPNGYIDLHGQMLMLDDGAALGTYITHYRDIYFSLGFNGFDYVLQPDGAQRIEQRIAPYVYRLPYTELPPLQDDIRMVELAPAERKLYEKLKKDMLVELGGETITAANSAATFSKLKQLANGAVYNVSKEWIHVHDAKIEAIAELVEELGGSPLLIGYEFRSDLERLQKRFPTLRTFDGTNEREAQALEADWNANRVEILAAHPASVGHGLNLQQGAASHIAWMSPTIDYELYDQFIRRLRRRGNASDRVMNHIFLAKDTVDDVLTLPAIRDKAITQDTLHRRLAEALGIPAAGHAVTEKEPSMVMKLSRQTTGAAQVNAAAPVQVYAGPTAARIQPKGWGTPAPAEQATPQEEHQPFTAFGQRRAEPADVVEQKAAIERKITQRPEDRGEALANEEQPPASAKAQQMFSPAIRQQLQAPKGEADRMAREVDDAADKASEQLLAQAAQKRTRKPKVTEVPVTEADTNACLEAIGALRTTERDQRYDALKLAIEYAAIDPQSDCDTMEVAKAFLDFLQGKA